MAQVAVAQKVISNVYEFVYSDHSGFGRWQFEVVGYRRGSPLIVRISADRS